MEYVLNYINLLAFGLSLPVILLLCFCWNKKQNLTQKRNNFGTDVSVTSCQKITNNHCKYFTTRLNRSHRNAFSTATTTSTTTTINHINSNHAIIKNSDLFISEGDLAYATTVGINTNINSSDILSPSNRPLLRQESNSHRNCELPPVPTYSNASFTENKHLEIDDENHNHSNENPVLEDNSDQLTYYYSVPTVRRFTDNDHHLYDVAIPKLQSSIKSSTIGIYDANSRCYSLCDDPASDSDGLYASVSHPPLPSVIGSATTRQAVQDMETLMNVEVVNNFTHTDEKGMANRRHELCQSPYYSQLKDDCDVVNGNNGNSGTKIHCCGVANTTANINVTMANNTTTNIIVQFPKPFDYRYNKTLDKCYSSKQPTCIQHHTDKKNRDYHKCSIASHLYAQVTPCIRTRQSVLTDSELTSGHSDNNSIYSSNYIRPPIPVRGYDQTDIDLVNQIRSSSRPLDTTTSQLNNHRVIESCKTLTESNNRNTSVCDSLANPRPRNALPVLYSITKHDCHQSLDDSDPNQESSEYERIYPVTTSSESMSKSIIRLVSNRKQHNNTSSLDNKHLEHAYTDIPNSINNLTIYAQVYYPTTATCESIDYSIIKTTESFNNYNNKQSSPSNNIAFIKDYNYQHSCLNEMNQVNVTSKSSNPFISDTVVYSVPHEFYPLTLSKLNDKLLAEMQAFRHMDSELDLTQPNKYFMANNSDNGAFPFSNSFMSDREANVKNTACDSTLHVVVTHSLTNESQHEDIDLMTPLMERSTDDCSLLSTIRRNYSKDNKNQSIPFIMPTSSSESLLQSTILSVSSLSLCKSSKSPPNYSISCDLTTTTIYYYYPC
ncbi:hypothetical protein MN116_008564 [Schistosoma mekongi]|uniref:Uncharacterized protein n=1 Tax=Schistosoma mekongi TaxID=38744 RepID=A0AAE2D1G0_SCHME|nr:hypothetical protein MN116_008564 [Schistosoma mekongi]